MGEELEKDVDAIYKELQSQGKELIRVGSIVDIIQKMYSESKEDLRTLTAKIDSIQSEVSSKLDLLTSMNKEQDRYFTEDCNSKHDKVDNIIQNFKKDIEIKQIELQQTWSTDFSSFKKLIMSQIDNKILNKKVIALMGFLSVIISVVFSIGSRFIDELIKGHLMK